MRRKEALAALAAAAFARPLTARAQTAQPLRVATLPQDAGSEIFYATDLGFFSKAGIDVKIDIAQNGPAVAAAVASNALDVGFSNALSIEVAYKRGLPFVFIAPAGMYSSAAPTSLMMVRKDSPIRTARDLNGKTVGANGLRNIGQMGPMIWIDKNGGDSSTVKFVEIPGDEMAPALVAGRLDAAFLPEPQVSEAKPVARILGKPYDAIADVFMIGGYFTTRAWIDAHPDLYQKFVTVMRETAVWANRNQDKSAVILAKYTKIDLDVIRHATRARFGETLTPQMIAPTIDLAARYKLIDAVFPAQELIYQPSR
jgi:NitT/TauT family transport system substrate-binding protein